MNPELAPTGGGAGADGDRIRSSGFELPVALLGSFAWPGVAQVGRGARRLGILLAVPQAVLVVGALVAVVGGSSVAIGWFLSPTILLGIVALDLLVLGTRLYALVDAYRGSDATATRSMRGASATLLVILVIVSLGVHGASAQVAVSAYATLTTVFAPGGPQGGAFSDDPTASPSVATPRPSRSARPTRTPTPSPTPEPTASPTPRPDWIADGRFNMLLVGADAGPGRWKLRTDTMILLTVDVTSGRAALIGIPRNLRYAPMPPPLDGVFPNGFTDLLNSLWVYVDENPGSYPGDPGVAPFAAVQDAIGVLTGFHVDAMAVAELQGFVRAVDALGGLDIDVPAQVYDARYPTPDGSGSVELFIPAGAQHLDGWHALAYARTRHQDSDYARMDRQQTVLVALQAQLRCNLVARLPELLTIVGDTLWTNLPIDQLPGVVDLARRVDADAITRMTLAPPSYPQVLDPAAVERIRAAVAGIFAVPQPTPGPSATPGAPAGC